MTKLMILKVLMLRRCHFWYFLDKGFRFQPTACNGCYDMLMMSIYIKNITILNISGLDNCCIVVGISKSEAIN